MLEHIARDTNNLDGDGDTTEYLSYAIHEDFQSTVWALSNASAVVKERYTYKDTFGVSNTLNAAGSDIGEYSTSVYSRKRLHGSVVESVSKLYDQRFRWSDPMSGNFISRDPIGARDSLNVTQEFRHSPLQWIDPNGLTAVRANFHGGRLGPTAIPAPTEPPEKDCPSLCKVAKCMNRSRFWSDFDHRVSAMAQGAFSGAAAVAGAVATNAGYAAGRAAAASGGSLTMAAGLAAAGVLVATGGLIGMVDAAHDFNAPREGGASIDLADYQDCCGMMPSVSESEKENWTQECKDLYDLLSAVCRAANRGHTNGIQDALQLGAAWYNDISVPCTGP